MRGSRGRSRFIGMVLSMIVLASMVLVACQSAPAASPTAAPAAPTKAPAAAPAGAAPTAAAPAPAATAAPAAATKEVTVKLLNLPAFSGPISQTGIPTGKAVNEYFRYLNDQGGVPYKDPKSGETIRAKFDVQFEDTGYDGTRALNSYIRFKDQGIKAVFSLGGVVISAMAEAVARDKIPLLASGSPNTVSMAVKKPQYVITDNFPYNLATMEFVAYAKKQFKQSRPPVLGLVYFDSASGKQGMIGVVEYAEATGWKVLPKEALSDPITDTSIQVKRLMSGNPDYIYVEHLPNTTSVMMKDAARLGFAGKTQWVNMGPSFDAAVFQKLAPQETDGVMAYMMSTVTTDLDVPGVKLANEIHQKYQGTPMDEQVYMAWSNIAGWFVRAGVVPALEKVGYEGLTGEAIRNAMFTAKNVDAGGVYQGVNVTDATPWLAGKGRFVQLKGGKVVPMSEWTDALEPEMLKFAGL